MFAGYVLEIVVTLRIAIPDSLFISFKALLDVKTSMDEGKWPRNKSVSNADVDMSGKALASTGHMNAPSVADP